MKYKIRMTLKSPLFIGGSVQTLNPVDYIRYGNYLYPISEQAFFEFLQEKNLLDLFSLQLGKKYRSPQDLLKDKNLLNKEALNRISKESIKVAPQNYFREYHPFIKDIYQQPYVPGSAVKGALRTGILYGILQKMKMNNIKQYNKLVVQKIESIKHKKGNNIAFLDNIERQSLQNFYLNYRGLGKVENPHKDLLRAIKVSDSNSLSQNQTTIMEIKVLNFNNESQLYCKASVFVECLPAETEVEFEISIDEHIYDIFKSGSTTESLPFEDIEDIFSFWKQLSKGIFADEYKYFEFALNNRIDNHSKTRISINPLLNYYRRPTEEVNFRLGWGSGLNSMTMLLLLEPKLRQQWGRVVSDRDFPLFPKTRKIIWDNDQLLSPLGWAKLDVI